VGARGWAGQTGAFGQFLAQGLQRPMKSAYRIIEDPMRKGEDRDPYFIHSVAHAADVLRAFGTPKEILRLKDVVDRTGHSKNTVFRVLYTLERTGLVEKVGAREYRCTIHQHRTRKYKIGYAAQGSDYLFSHQVTYGLKREAERLGNIELLALDNRYNPKMALRNAEVFIRERCDLVIEFQTNENIAPILSAKYQEARIPVIAVEIPHPGAVFFGANNYQAGLMGGRALGQWVREHWEGKADEIILMELPRAGPVPRARLTGIHAGILEELPELESCPVVYLDGDGCFDPSFRAVRKHLRATRAKRCIVSGINDASVLGALRAFEDSGMLSACVAAGQNAAPEGRDELRRNSRFIASVAYFPERYGAWLLKLAEDILTYKPTPPAVFVRHQLLTPKKRRQVLPR
jgi:ribose transport system substrate-binding protein